MILRRIKVLLEEETGLSLTECQWLKFAPRQSLSQRREAP